LKLPFLVSVPHAGLQVPQEVKDICILTPEEIYADSDEGAAEVYFDLEKVVEAFCTSGIARAIVDMNRAVDDFRKDGVIKTHTCYDVRVYKEFPSRKLIEQLLTKYYHPYHQKLERLTNTENIVVGIDCHTMAAVGPPIGPDAGKSRPLVCLSNADGVVILFEIIQPKSLGCRLNYQEPRVFQTKTKETGLERHFMPGVK
jgi:formiminoglutamase